MVSSTLAVLSLASYVSASWTSNLNYRSPSEHHPGLGIALHKVNKRNTPNKFSASQLNFTHGVASGDRNKNRRARCLQQ
jgi:alkaline phosphatase D